MATVRPFACIRPAKKFASRVAELPYDVYNTEEARKLVENNRYSFMNIDRAETQFEDDVDPYDEIVYNAARDYLNRLIDEKVLLLDADRCYYIYELTMKGRVQTGIVGCVSIDDVLEGTVKKHENTRVDKEQDRINHVCRCDAQTGPIFLAYKDRAVIDRIVDRTKKKIPLYSFTSDDGVRHRVWKIAKENDILTIEAEFARTNDVYIADGHHRCASAVKVGLFKRGEEGEYTGEEEYNYFLSIMFPDSQLKILPYNRLVKDLNGRSNEKFIEELLVNFDCEPVDAVFTPSKKGEIAMILEGRWYRLMAKDHLLAIEDPVKRLDVSLLQDYVLDPILAIKDPRTDKRVEFVGGIRGLGELEKRVSEDMVLGFGMFPTSLDELFSVADAGRLMPPKSTWFEPKPRSGLFIHDIGTRFDKA